MCRAKQALWIVAFLTAAFLPVHSRAQEGTPAVGQIAGLTAAPAVLDWRPLVEEPLALAVAGPDGLTFRQEFEAGKAPSFSLFDAAGNRLPDGNYVWELRVIPTRHAGVRERSLESAQQRPRRALVQTGYFAIRDGSFVVADPAAPAAAAPPRSLRNVTANDQTVPGDLTVQGDACIGKSCTTTDTANAAGLTIKDSGPIGIYFDDTYDFFSGSHDWKIEPNPLGYGDLFRIVDIDDAHSFQSFPFSIQGGAPNDSLYIRANGNVGIGSFPDGSPQAKLQVVGLATADTWIGVGPWPGSGPSFNLGYDGATFGRGAGFLNVKTDGSATAPNPSLRFLTADVQRMIITNTGNVGIGTSSPAVVLDAKTNVSGQVVARLQNSSATGYSGIEYLDNAGNVDLFFGLNNAAANTRLNSFNNYPIVILTNSTERMRVTSAGDVGIGTSTPGSKLDVNGNVTINGNITATGTKSFAVVDPGDARQAIYYAALEGPEAGTYFRGTARTSGGEAVIELPDYFARITEPERLTVQLTPLGSWGQLYVAEKTASRLVVRLPPGSADVEFDYFVQGVRKGYLDYQVRRPNSLPVE